MADRGLALLNHLDQWSRCTLDDTVLLPEGGVGLAWAEPPPPSRWDGNACRDRPLPIPAAHPAGLTHDPWCRTWRTRPLDGTVEVSRGRDAPEGSGCPGGLRQPTGIAIDDEDRLYVVETLGRAVLVSDLWSGRVVRRVPIAGRPVDAVATGSAAIVLVDSPDSIVRIEDGRTTICALRRPCGYPRLHPTRVTMLSGRVIVLWAGDETAVVADIQGQELQTIPAASDFEGTADGLLVIGRRPGDSFLRLRAQEGHLIADEPLSAPGYDAAALTIDPSGRIVYTTNAGVHSTEGSTARHVRDGQVTTYRLDSGTYRTRWGRVFLDACLPVGTSAIVRAVTSDEDDDALPASTALETTLETTPWVPVVARDDDGLLAAAAGDVPPPYWSHYECGVDAPAGRYLWLQLELAGTERSSPKVRSLYVERPGHALLTALPRNWSSVEDEAQFLQGFLAPAEGLLHDLDAAAADRAVLVDPRTTPDAMLAWVASLTGITLDRRWSEEALRELIAEVFELYARRGTIGALERTLAIYLRRTATIVEQWRLRGLGGAVLGLQPGGLDAPTVAGNSRAAGMLGHFTVGGERPSTSSYDRFAHRFTVLVPGRLTDEQRVVVRDIVGQHKPSHTLADVCELGDGLPVGRLRLGLTAYVGPRRGRPTAVLGTARLGRGGTVGVPACGARIGDSRVGRVRVG